MPDGNAEAQLLATPRAVHVVAIGGSAMSGIAAVLVSMGHRVSGSDLRDSPRLDALRDLGVRVTLGHDAANLPADVELVVHSAAIGPDNPELVAARARGVTTWTRTDALRAFAGQRRTVAVAGSHGKTTTTAMLTLGLREAGWDPGWFVGGDVPSLGATAAWRQGDWLVVEADESDGTFLHLGAEAAIVTSVEPDHLAHYGTVEALEQAFTDFLRSVPGPKVVCGDDPTAARLAAATPGAVTYGFGDADYCIREYAAAGLSTAFALEHDGRLLGTLVLPVPGRHNATNAAAVVAMAAELGAPFASVQRALRGYTGVARRFELRGVRDGVTFVDDYAHLPTEVASMIDAAREGNWSRVVVVFQPHRYTRTATIGRDFADAFTEADLVVLTDVYAADEPPIADVSGHVVLRAVLDAHPDLPVVYLPTRADLVTQVPRLVRAGDLVLTLGAGDLTTLPDEWVA